MNKHKKKLKPTSVVPVVMFRLVAKSIERAGANVAHVTHAVQPLGFRRVLIQSKSEVKY